LLAGALRALGEFSDAAGGPELSWSVTHDGAASDDLAAPVFHDAQTVGEDREWRVRAGHVGSTIGQIVAELTDDGHHRVERAFCVVQEVVDRDHAGSRLTVPMEAVLVMV
jgi:hypothetical protein